MPGTRSSPPPSPRAPCSARPRPVTAAAATAGPRPATAAGPPTSADCVRDLGIACYSPRQLQRAYNLGPLYARGYDGRGRTIVIVDPFGSPTIRRDLGVFDRAFGLPAPPSLRIAQPVGQVPRFSLKNAGMVDKAAETTLDVEWSHAIAPGASILLVETPVQETLSGGGFPQFMAAEDYVIRDRLGDVISQSFSLPEQNFPSRSALLRLRYAYTGACRHQVTVLAATNDFGAAGPTPTAGGTELHLNAAGERTSPDTAWNDSRNAPAGAPAAVTSSKSTRTRRA